MTSTGTYQGLNDTRNSSKVLKPPGGGSSDIFGAESESSRGKVKTNANQSQLSKGFFAGTDDMPDHASDVRAAPVTNGIYSASSGGGSAPETPRSKPEGNPVTGAGYDNLQQNGGGGGSRGSSIAGSDKSSTDSSPSPTVPRMKNRVPPGGFSSGLW